MNPEAGFPRITGSADASVRPAVPQDAAEVARVQLVTWRTAYRAALPPEVLDDWDADAATASWASAIVSPPLPGTVFSSRWSGTPSWASRPSGRPS
ncbi:hypothetical protein [Blastococcus brunescens]|uniref:N-acetyltransferase domain-containing protein n=1 Tax=Blastococcus brunescens TaxID=1564165 RepID=A0ABZ1AV88_9ACTN|nr:hypothetical protein [Blastococcus sp. BMG 8361]WRL62488.1 hypothetical protein U6N30_21085 [Blastococcus sp. BMG 8361]